MTRFEKFKQDIQTMSLDEFANFLMGSAFCDSMKDDRCSTYDNCVSCFREWLQQEIYDKKTEIRKTIAKLLSDGCTIETIEDVIEQDFHDYF